MERLIAMIIISILVILFVVFVFIYYAVKSYKLVFALTHPTKYNYQIDLKIPYTYKKFEFITKDGIKLTGIDYIPKTDCKGIIFACHFLGGNKEAILLFLDSLLKSGYRILSFDNRNHGESETTKSIKNFLQSDFSSFYQKVKSMNIKGPYGVIGFSMGASQALWALCKYSDIQAAITDSGPLLFVKKYFKYVLNNKRIKNPVIRSIFLFIFLRYVGFKKMAKRNINFLRNLKGKSLYMIHGEKDNIISIDNPQFVHNLVKLNNTSTTWFVPHARHLTIKNIKSKDYDERIVAFFDKNLAREDL